MKYSLTKHTEIKHNTDNSLIVSNNRNAASITLDETGALMLSGLSFHSTPLKILAENAARQFNNVTGDDIIDDLKAILSELVEIGLVDAEDDECLTNLQINVTERCNERCVHCYIPAIKRSKGAMLDKNLILSVIDEYADIGGKIISFSGGELFLYKQLTEIIEKAVQKGLSVVVLSNLTMLSEELIACFETNNVDVQVSLYSVDNDIHDSITGIKGSCAKTRSAITRLRHKNISVMISCPVMQQNLDGFEDVLDFAESIGAKVQCNCALMADLERCKTNLENRLTPAQSEDFFTRLLLYREKHGLDCTSLKLRDTSEYSKNHEWYAMQYPCGAIHSSLSINGDGTVTPCPGWNEPLGNIHHDSLKDIWENNEEHKRVLALTNKDMGKCYGCKYYDFCYICPALKYQNSGELAVQDETTCEMARTAFDVEQKFKNK